MTPFTSHNRFKHASRTKPGVTDVKCRLASGSHMRALTPGAPRLCRCTHDKAALTPAQPILPVRPSLPLVTRDCQPRCQHTLTQTSSPPTIRPVYLRRDLGLARHYAPRAPARARRRFTWIDQRPSSACSLVRTTSVIARISPAERRPHRRKHTHGL